MKNDSFWISLFVFILLMCSCKSKKIVSDLQSETKHVSDISYLNESVKIDTSKTAYFANEIQNIVIEEDITAIEYDKESGKPVKETKTKRKIAQDSEKVAIKEETKGVNIHSQDSLNHFADTSKKIESETKEESIGGQETFGKYFGLVIGAIIGLLIIYLLKKLRIN